MSRVNLTPKQRRAYDFIAAEIRATGTAPTYDQIAAALQITSKSGVHRMVNALVERGWLRRLRYRARGLALESAAPTAALLAIKAARRLLDDGVLRERPDRGVAVVSADLLGAARTS